MTTTRRGGATTRRREQSSLLAWSIFGAAAIVLCGVAGYVVQNAADKPDPAAAPLSSRGFDLAEVPQHPQPEMRAAPYEPAPAAQSPAPIAPTTAHVSALAAPAVMRPATPAAPAPKASDAAAAEAKVRAFPGFQALVAAPANFFAAQTFLGSTKKMGGFLKDPARVSGWCAHPVIQAALSSPAIVKLMLKPAVVHAFIGSPAMGDPTAVAMLAKSKIAREVLKAQGVKEALASDPSLVMGLVADPQVGAWLGRNPAAMTAFSEAGLALAGPLPKRR